MKTKKKKEKFNVNGFLKLIESTHPKYWMLIVGLLLGFAGTMGQLIVPKFAQMLVNDLQKGVNGELLAIIIGLFLVGSLLSAASIALTGFFGESVVANLRDKLWNKLLHLNIPYFDSVKVGKISSRLVNDTDQIKDLLASYFPDTVTSIFQMVGAYVLMFLMDWHMTLIMMLSIPIILLIMRPVMHQTSIIGHDRQKLLADFNGQANDTLGEIRLVKASNAENYEKKVGNKSVHRLYRIGLKESLYDSIAFPLTGTIMMALMVTVLVYGAHRVAIGAMSMGTMLAFLMYLFQVISPVMTIGQFATNLAKTNGATKHVAELLDVPEEVLSGGNDHSIAGKPLAMKHVDFAYADGQYVLHDINFEAKPNTTIAFVGPSGSGKSTILNLIERYYLPQSGEITIGNENINEINLQSWRKQIGFVSQDSAIMAGTIRHNLTYGLNEEFSDEQLWHVLKLAYADGFVEKMPDGLDTEVGERGLKVSGGQRQRLAIARAFLRDPKLLMLDEATASLDSESEAMVQKALASLMQNRTTITIAHRLSTIIDSDDIYFIQNGEVLGHGSHEELMKKLPIYREYVKIQFKE